MERTTYDGGVAQLGEHLPCKQGVMGSNPIISIRPDACKGHIDQSALTHPKITGLEDTVDNRATGS